MTFDYNNQPQSRLKRALPDSNSVDGTFPLCVVFTVNKDIVNLNYYRSDDGTIDDISMYEDLFNSSEKLYSSDITVTHTDGSTDTQTLIFKYVNEDGDTYFSAKIASDSDLQ